MQAPSAPLHATRWWLLVATAVSSSNAQTTDGPGTWPAIPHKSCHSADAGGRIINISGVTHAQCAAACDKNHCACFDMDDKGSCRGTRAFWGFRSSSDRTAYSSGTTPAPAPPHRHQPPPPPPMSPVVQKLMLEYSTIRNETCAKAAAHAPALPQAASSTFLDAYRAFNGSNDERPVLQSARAILALANVQAFLGLPDSFSTADGLDAMLVKCTILSAATPLGLAEFAANGTAEEALVDRLLGDSVLMRDMLVAGGAREGKYGNAMQILSNINKASDTLPLTKPVAPRSLWDDRSPETMLHRLALGTALGHAAPIQTSYTELNASDAFVDPVVRYLNYEKAYKAGELDPAIEVLTTFECRHTTDSDALEEDLAWLRDTMAIYRPDNIARPYHWRYAEAVHTDVAYGHPACDSLPPAICNGHKAQIPAAGGECGPRAFFGRFTRKAFGLPTWGVTEPGATQHLRLPVAVATSK